jgi:uncharacterized membrane protein YciS (DUF1049 family)
MRMLLTCLLGSVALGFAYEKAAQPVLEQMVADGNWQRPTIAIGAVFVGALFGWMVKGLFAVKKT